MIKKLLKSLLGMFFVGFGIINFSSADYKVYEVSLDKSTSFINTNYEIGFLPNSRFLTNYLGVSKAVIGLDNQSLVWWGKNGRLYLYDLTDYWLNQGFFNHMTSCDFIPLDGTGLNNCSTPVYWSDDFVINFLSTIKNGDTVYVSKVYNSHIGCGNYCSYRQLYYNICFSSTELNKSICFIMSENQQKGTASTPGSEYPLIDSQNLPSDTNFSTLSNNFIGDSPALGNTNTNTNTNNNYTCPTIAQVMQNMGNNYNTGLCYNNTTYFNGTSFEQITKDDIFTIYNDNYENYTNRLSIYRNNCTNANTTEACQRAFSGEYKKYSIISNAINSNVDEKKLRNYCNLGLNYDPNATTCVASGGGIKETYTTEEKINDIINNGIIPTPNTNQQTTGNTQDNVLNSLNKCENGDRDCYINDRNFIDSLKNIYGKITGLFRERNGVNGIIPDYILRITFLTILFTVIFKK